MTIDCAEAQQGLPTKTYELTGKPIEQFRDRMIALAGKTHGAIDVGRADHFHLYDENRRLIGVVLFMGE